MSIWSWIPATDWAKVIFLEIWILFSVACEPLSLCHFFRLGFCTRLRHWFGFDSGRGNIRCKKEISVWLFAVISHILFLFILNEQMWLFRERRPKKATVPMAPMAPTCSLSARVRLSHYLAYFLFSFLFSLLYCYNNNFIIIIFIIIIYLLFIFYLRTSLFLFSLKIQFVLLLLLLTPYSCR